LDVGKDLLTFCDQQLYRELEERGEDPSWIFGRDRDQPEEEENYEDN
jgi:hypothetical protein